MAVTSVTAKHKTVSRAEAAFSRLYILLKMQGILLRKRMITWWCLTILAVGLLLTVGGQLIFLALASQPAVNTNCPATTTQTNQQSQTATMPCVPMTPTQQHQQEAQRQSLQHDLRTSLTFPSSLGTAGGVVQFLGVVIICILAGVFVGSEYSFGTQRVALARGTLRFELVISQILLLACLALLLTAVSLLIVALIGLIAGPALGGSISLPSFAGWGEILLYWLTLSFELWAYALLAFVFATLGQSVSAGIAGAIGYLAIQSILLPTLQFTLASLLPESIGKLLQHLPAVFLNANGSALLSRISSMPLALSSAPLKETLPGWQALLVLSCYALVSIGLAWWTLQKRDVTQ